MKKKSPHDSRVTMVVVEVVVGLQIPQDSLQFLLVPIFLHPLFLIIYLHWLLLSRHPAKKRYVVRDCK